MTDDNQISFAEQIPLAQDSVIGEYRILRPLKQDGEGISYLAKDSIVGDLVHIQEFFPSKMARRCEDGCRLEPLADCATKFKYFRASFLDLYRTLKQEKDNKCLIPIIQILELNATVYAVSEYRELKTLEEYLEECGGRESWCRAKKYMLPLYNSLSNLHKKGITHQGICPQNILLDEELSPFWTGFALSEMRTAQGEITPQLFEGYSAPEQYQLESWQGTWTDVYSVAAVTYRVLTGVAPMSAQIRKERDCMDSAAMLCDDIEPNISEALWEAMELDSAKRYDSIDLLTEKMLQTVSSNTAVFRVDDTKIKQSPSEVSEATQIIDREPRQEEQKEEGSPKSYTAIMIFALLVVMAFALPEMYSYLKTSWAALSNSTSKPMEITPSQVVEIIPDEVKEEPGPENHEVENFVGAKASDVLENRRNDQWYYFETVEQYSDKFEKGTIIEQSIPSGTSISRKTSMTLYISRGPENEPLPPLAGKTKDEAIAVLTQKGKTYRVVEGENPNYSPGTVFRTEPPEGTMLKKEGKEQIILYVVKETPKEEEPEPPKLLKKNKDSSKQNEQTKPIKPIKPQSPDKDDEK